MMSDKSDAGIRSDVIGYLRSRTLDDDASYLRHGRAFRDLDDKSLLDRWCAEFLARADAGSLQITEVESGLASELRLRSIEIPADRVEGAIEKLATTMKGALKELAKRPEAHEAFNESIQREIDAFIKEKGQGGH